MQPLVIAYGQSGMISSIGDSAFKTPFFATVDDIEFEKSVYEKLGSHSRIAKYIRLKGKSLEFKFYEKGDVSRKISDPDFEIPLMRWADQIIEALVFIHSKNIIHGDLRCSNLLVTDNFNLVLTDFGAAAVDGIKKTNIFYDTRHCIPDFQDSGHNITPQDDLFALATVLYHLATKKLPYDDLRKDEVTRLYRSGTFPDVSGLEIGCVIDKCWRMAYSSATEVQTEFRRLQHSPTSKSFYQSLQSFAIPLLVTFGIAILFTCRMSMGKL